jgi:peptide/nickel transport system ATP-binding protein
MSDVLLSVEDLTVQYATRRGIFNAVDGVSFTLNRGESLGILGESGCGKSTLAMSLLRLLPENGKITGGRIFFDDVDLLPVDEELMRRYRWNRIAMVFQSAMNSLDPIYRVRDQITEALELHKSVTGKEARHRVNELFETVGVDTAFADRFPHEFSGGMKQRAVIAMALACDPDLLIADEPTTALDVIVQDRVVGELREIQKRMGMSMIYISHDTGVIAEITDKVAVMYAGRIVEMGDTLDVFQSPAHPYTRALLSSVPGVTGERQELVPLAGSPPDLIEPPDGCRFHPRCPAVTEVCSRIAPRPEERGREHWASCWHPVG